MIKINPCKKKDTHCSSGKYFSVPCSALNICKQRYLWPQSLAVKSHNAQNNDENKFNGCQNIEEYLVRERLVGYSLKEAFTKDPKKIENKNFDLWADDPSKDGSGCPRCEKVRETLVRGVKRCLKLLTEPQREAVKKYYMKNDHRKTKKEVATKLGISKDSQQNRLDYAEKKILNFF